MKTFTVALILIISVTMCMATRRVWTGESGEFKNNYSINHTCVPIENLLCMKKIISQTVWLERMKVNLVIFTVLFIFQILNVKH